MPRLLLCLLFFSAALCSASVEGRWNLLSLEQETKGEQLGTVQFNDKTVNFTLADGTRLTLTYTVSSGYLAGQASGEGKRTFVILRGRFDGQRDSLTMALIIRNLDNAAANRSIKVNAARVR
jgi:hypothetical protein